MSVDPVQDDPLGYSFFVLTSTLEEWFRDEPKYQKLIRTHKKPSAARMKPTAELSKRRNQRLRAIQKHAKPITLFADRQGIDITAIVRLMRAVEGRCDWSLVDEQAVKDAIEQALVRHLSLRDSVVKEKTHPRQADSADVRDLCKLLEKHSGKGKALIDIAREFTRETRGNDRKARSLLRQARRYSHLWKRADT